MELIGHLARGLHRELGFCQKDKIALKGRDFGTLITRVPEADSSLSATGRISAPLDGDTPHNGPIC